jgi:catechol 2,3-dioxygenase-like lactoylglutathione lyase family enzyme
VAFLDPPKETAREAIAALREYGIDIKIITGDNEVVTRKICKEVGLLVDKPMLGKDVAALTDAELADAAVRTTIFTKMSSLEKSRVIRALQSRGHTVTKERTMTTASKDPKAGKVDMKLEVSVISVSDVDRAKHFYENLGWRLDADFIRVDGSRAVQFTPPGSSTSIQLGTGPALPHSGVDVSEVFHRGPQGRVPGPDPDRPSYGSLATFNDQDGNVWLLQQVTQRLPGRVSADQATFTSPTDLAAALRRAATAHGDHEKRTGGHDANWPDWYAEYIIREQTGQRLPD